mmetsp:Transcript_56619/g.99506  ORF Transcript_56619/g.99506 Transcript_56619/m.99506 type:complete len:810 (-) Transcript_56619:59-2488(-)
MSFSLLSLAKRRAAFKVLGAFSLGRAAANHSVIQRLCATSAGPLTFSRAYHAATLQPSLLSSDDVTSGIVDTSNAFFEKLFRQEDPAHNRPVPRPPGKSSPYANLDVTIKVFIGKYSKKAKQEGRILLVHDSKTKTWEKAYGQCKVEYSTGEVYEGSLNLGLREGSGRCVYPDRSTKVASDKENTLNTASPATTAPDPSTLALSPASTASERVYIYQGTFHNGYRHGKGTMTYPNGDVYEGKWERDHRHGAGTLTSLTGEKLTGVYKNDKLLSGEGSMVLKSGETATGTWVNGMMNGHGTTTHPDGTTYTGNFVDNYPHGTGKMMYKSGETYEGEFVRRKRHGQGVLTYANGDKYEGQFENGKRHGQGTHTSGPQLQHVLQGEFRNGSVYTGSGSLMMNGGNLFKGEWVEGVLLGSYSDPNGSNVAGEFRNNRIWTGEGTLVEGEVTYEGVWVEGKRTGQGKLIVAGHTLEGEFQNDTIYNGEGVMVYPDCSTYRGRWISGQRQGEGMFTNIIGQTITGRFKNDKMYTGSGVEVLPNGVVYEGAWVKGQKCGHGKFTYIDGTVAEGEVQGESIYHGISTLSIGNAVLTHVITNGLRSGEWSIAYADGTSRSGGSAAYLHETQSSVLYPNGDIYEGYFVSGKLHGQGKITDVDQQVLEGEFREGLIFNGTGVLKSANGALYEGTFVEGKRHGQGKFTCEKGYTVTGEFKDNKLFNGSGSRRMLSGDLYKGMWVNGKFHGTGKITYANGSILEGEFIEGRIVTGKGTLVGTNVYEGEWIEGKLHGQGKITFANGYVLKGTFKNGVHCPVER